MQTTYSAPLTFWQAVVYLLLAAFSASGWVKVFLDRKKVTPEIHKTEAETGLAVAQTENVRVQASTGAADAVLRMISYVERSSHNSEDMRRELEEWREKAAAVPGLETQIQIYETQLQRARGDLESCHAESEFRGLLVCSLLSLLTSASRPAAPVE